MKSSEPRNLCTTEDMLFTVIHMFLNDVNYTYILVDKIKTHNRL